MKHSSILILCFIAILNLNAQDYRVGDHELMLMPTAYTMEKGNSYFSDYELFFLNYTYAVSPSTHIGIFTIFPVTKHFLETVTLGAKQQYLNSDFIKAALWSTYTPKVSGFTVGNVFSLGKNSHGFHLGISTASSFEDNTDEWEFIYMLGYKIDISRKLAFMAEYTNLETAIEAGFNGMLTLGIRFQGESTSWDLAGVRPLESTGDFLFFPLLKATFLF